MDTIAAALGQLISRHERKGRMTYDEIRETPTTYMDVERGICHESLLRAFEILLKVKWLLNEGTTPRVVLELIDMMETPRA